MPNGSAKLKWVKGGPMLYKLTDGKKQVATVWADWCFKTKNGYGVGFNNAKEAKRSAEEAIKALRRKP